MDRTCGSNITNRADSAGSIRARPTPMERNITAIKPTDNGVILAVPDTNTIHTHDNRKLPNKPKQKQDIPQAKIRKAGGKLHVLDTKGPRSMEGYNEGVQGASDAPGARPRG